MTELTGQHIPHEVLGMPENPQLAHVIENIAGTLVDDCVHVKKGDKVLIWYEDRSTPLALALSKKCQQNDASEVSFFKRDLQGDVDKLKHISADNEIEALHAEQKRLIEDADVIIIAAATENQDKIWEGIDKDKRKKIKSKYYSYFGKAHASRLEQNVENPKRWTLVRWPIPEEARIEHLTDEEYFKIFLEACDQPWEQIKEAQEILIEKLDKGKQLKILVDENNPDERKRTDLQMSIDGMTFGNSTIDVNYPGSEVFSAPVLYSVSGQLYAPGEFLFQGQFYRDLFFRFDKGKIIEATYALDGKQKDLIKDVLNKDVNGEGALYLGEIAFGTNPGLVRKLINTLLCEKVGGSFHIAVGHCYDYKTYNGKRVKVNNGNTETITTSKGKKRTKAGIHWDIAVLMHPNAGGGKVLLDEEVISENGCFKDPRLAILNPKI